MAAVLLFAAGTRAFRRIINFLHIGWRNFPPQYNCSLRIYTSIFPQSQFFRILALGSGQRLLYRLGSGLRLLLVLVLRFCALNLINS